jgi:hypothetical protein
MMGTGTSICADSAFTIVAVMYILLRVRTFSNVFNDGFFKRIRFIGAEALALWLTEIGYGFYIQLQNMLARLDVIAG